MKKIQQNTKYGFADDQGNVIVPCIYDYIFPFIEGFAVVRHGDYLNGKFGVINRKGDIIIPVDKTKIYYLTEGYFLVRFDWKEQAFFDTSGKQVSPIIKIENISPLREGWARTELGYANFNFVNTLGELLLKENCADAGLFSEGLARIKSKENKWGFINTKGEVVIPCSFYYVLDFNEGMTPVSTLEDGKTLWGYINPKGELVVPYQYTSASRFKDGRAVVTESLPNYKYHNYFIDTLGNRTEIDFTGYMEYNSNIISYHLTKNKHGIINTKQEEIAPYIYDHISYEFCGVKQASRNGRYGALDMNEQDIIPFDYDKTRMNSASPVYSDKIRVSHYDDSHFFKERDIYRGVIIAQKNGKFGGFPILTNTGMTYTQEFIPVAYARESLVDDIGKYYLDNNCTFPVLDILEKLQSEHKHEASFGKDLLKTVNFLLETDQVEGVSIDTNIVFPLAIKWATSAAMNERIMSAHLIKALYLNFKKNHTPLIPVDYKVYQAFEKATEKKPIPLQDAFELIVPDYGFKDLFYHFVVDGLDYKAYVDTDCSVKYIDIDGNTLSKAPKGMDKTIEKSFKELTKTYSKLQPIVAQQFATHRQQNKTWTGEDWKALFLSNPFYFNLALGISWQTQTGTKFTLQDDQSMVDDNGDELEIGDVEIVGFG